MDRPGKGLGASAGAPAASAADALGSATGVGAGGETAAALTLEAVSAVGAFLAHPKLENIAPSTNHGSIPRTVLLLANSQPARNQQQSIVTF